MPSVLDNLFSNSEESSSSEHPVAGQFMRILKARCKEFRGLSALSSVCRTLRDRVRKIKYPTMPPESLHRASNEELNLVNDMKISVMGVFDGSVITCTEYLSVMFGFSQEELKHGTIKIIDCVDKSELQSHVKSSLTAFNTSATHIIYSRKMINKETSERFQGIGCACIYYMPDTTFYAVMFTMAEPLELEGADLLLTGLPGGHE